MQGLRLSALVIVTALLAGCSAPPAPAPEQPLSLPAGAPPAAPAAAEPDCRSAIPPEPYARWDFAVAKWLWSTRGLCPVLTDEESRTVEFILPPHTDEALVRQSVTYSGAGAVQIHYDDHDKFARVNVTIPSGPAGEQADLRLTGPWGPGGASLEMGFHLTRVPTARVETELRLGDGPWEPLKGTRQVPAQPLSLRFRLHGNVDPTELRSVVQKVLGQAEFRLEQPAADTLVVTVPEPPGQITFEPRRLHSPYGYVRQDGFMLYIGDPPTVVALDPATGQERVIGTAPLDIWTGSVSPDGRWALLAQAEAENCYETQVWLMDLTTGRAAEVPLHHTYSDDLIAWPAGRLVTAYAGTVEIYDLAKGRLETRTVPERFWGEASPDGRYLLGYVRDYEREKDRYAPITVLIYDVETGEERRFADVAQGRIPNHAWATTRLFWTPDGKGVLINDPIGHDPQTGGKAVLHLDPQTGATAPFTQPLPDEVAQRVWRDWGPVTDSLPGGEERQYGEGLILGKAPDGAVVLIRWSNGGRYRHCEGE